MRARKPCLDVSEVLYTEKGIVLWFGWI